MSNRWIFILSCAFTLLFQSKSYAQLKLNPDLKQAVQHALNKDVDLVNQQLELKKLQLEHKSVLSKYIPRVEASALYTHFNSRTNVDIPTKDLTISNNPDAHMQLFGDEHRMNSFGNIFHGGVTAHAILFSGGQILHGAKALEEKNKGTALMMENRKDEVIKSVIQSYDQLQLLQSAERLIDESERRLEKEALRINKAIDAGLAIPYDRDKIKLARLELEAKRADIKHKQELLVLKISQETDLLPEQIQLSSYPVEPLIINTHLEVGQRSEIKALTHFKIASEYNLKKEKGSLLPNIGAFGGYSYTSLFNTQASLPLTYLDRTAYLNLNHLTLNPTWIIGVGLKWEIFSGFERKHKIQEAQLGLQQIENKLEDTREKIALQFKKNKIDYENTLKQVDITRQAERIATNNNRIAEKQYQAGLINISERLSAENDLLQAAMKRIEAAIAQRNAALETLQSAGLLQSSLQID